MSEQTIERHRKFFKEFKALCKKYNISISHEDGHGAFIFEEYDEFNLKWLERGLESMIEWGELSWESEEGNKKEEETEVIEDFFKADSRFKFKTYDQLVEEGIVPSKEERDSWYSGGLR